MKRKYLYIESDSVLSSSTQCCGQRMLCVRIAMLSYVGRGSVCVCGGGGALQDEPEVCMVEFWCSAGDSDYSQTVPTVRGSDFE